METYKSLFNVMSFFGVDVGSENLKIVQIEKKEGKNSLISLGLNKMPEQGVDSEVERNLILVAELIKKVKKEAQILPNLAVVSLPESKVFTRVIELPAMTEEELEKGLYWELEEMVPIPLAEVNYDWQVLEKTQNNVSVLVAIAPKELTNKYLHLFELANVQLLALETEVLAINRALAFVAPQKTKLIVEMGAGATTIILVKGEKILLTHNLLTGGRTLTRAIAGSLGIEAETAEQYKQTYGIKENKSSGEQIVQAINQVFEIISGEIRKAVNFSQEAKSPVEMIILSGGAAVLPGLLEKLTVDFGIEVQLANPFSQLVYDENLFSRVKKFASSFTVAVGLALREVK